MKIFSSLHILAALGVLGVASAASAQVDTSQWKCTSCPYPKGTTGSVDVGAEYVSDSSQKYGDYTGLAHEGGYAILGGSASRRGDDGYWADISGSDLGLDSRRINGRAGREGLYTLRIGYAEIPRHLTEGAATPFLGSGGNVLTLPGGFPAGDTTSMPLASTLQGVDIGYKYRRLDLGGSVVGGKDWSYYLNYRHDERDGTRPTSGSFFSTASQFLAPVKEKTDQAEVGLSYGTKRWQATVSYQFSNFHNDNDSLTWSNPFFPVVAAPTPQQGQLALAPDNQFQQLRGTGAYDITPTIRLSADLAVGRMTQDQAFLSPTLNTSPTLIVPALPVSSLGGRVDTLNGGIRLTAAPMQGLRIIASYDHDGRDNKTPVNSYTAVTTDMFVNTTARSNTPFSYKIDRFKLIGDYVGSLPASMRISGAVEQDNRDRSYQEVVNTRETTLWGKLAAQPTEKMATWLKYAHSWRDNSTYGTSIWFGYAENPLLRKFYLADRERDVVEAHLDYAFNEKVSLGLSGDYANDDYNHSQVGLTSSRSANLAAELTVAFSERTQGRGFLQSQWIRSEQNGSQAFANPDWTGHVKDQFDTLGIGIKHAAIANKLDIGADLAFSRSRSDTSVDNAAAAPPFPTAKTDLDSVTLYGLYKLKDNFSILGSYTYEHYNSQDWRYDGVGPATVPNLLALGIQPPNYTVNVVRVALRYRF